MSRFAWLVFAVLALLFASLVPTEAQAGPLVRGAVLVFRGGKAVVSRFVHREFRPARRFVEFVRDAEPQVPPAYERSEDGQDCNGRSCR